MNKIETKSAKKYAPQAKYQASHYYNLTMKLPLTNKSVLDSIAKENGVSLTRLIKDAILQVYGVDCTTQK